MPHPSDPRLLTLHALRLKGFATANAVAAASGLTEAEVARLLGELDRAGLVTHREGRVSGWALTAAGRQEHAHLLVEDMDVSGARDRVHWCYQRFLDVNKELLETCTAWQLRGTGEDKQTNDHSDADYDAEVVGRLRRVHLTIRPVCTELGGLLDRFAPYGPRLDRALEMVGAGQRDWFTKPVIDSYHTVWFELHEDLLQSLQLERTREAV